MICKIHLLCIVLLFFIIQTSCHILKQRDNSIQNKIYSNAKANIGDKSWAKGVRRQAKRNPNVVYDKGVWKCNLFVYEIILASGLDIGTYECSSGITPPVAGDWYNYSSYLITNNAEFIGKGPEGINKAIPGDIITDGIHMGIYAGNDEVINAGLYDVHITNIKTIGNWGNSYGYGYDNNPFKIFRIKPNYQLNSANNIVSIASEDDHNNICDDRCHCNIMDNYYTPNNENISDNNLNSSGDSEKPKDDNSGANNLKQSSFFSIFIIFTTILIWQTHIIF